MEGPSKCIVNITKETKRKEKKKKPYSKMKLMHHERMIQGFD